ncbi:hypothetical protein BGW38_001539 [Lunasporangiospora selenospora]|uniref:Extracellular membrane protein CFEM domain-containing protein n=1 Tax=Lunasporangiospora selenospora TaxID=979761 RepID=A0A9P6FVF8_9FUNG|nr:hypothetical protein BGW38_001539 [Lunasporangiospora selenospora]
MNKIYKDIMRFQATVIPLLALVLAASTLPSVNGQEAPEPEITPECQQCMKETMRPIPNCGPILDDATLSNKTTFTPAQVKCLCSVTADYKWLDTCGSSGKCSAEAAAYLIIGLEMVKPQSCDKKSAASENKIRSLLGGVAAAVISIAFGF